jgi:hypothetical protein
MKGKYSAVLVCLGFFIILLLSGCPGELPPNCCPKIKGFIVQDPWVCPSNCPGGGKTRLTYELEFWKKNELCKPPKEFTVKIKNVTDNVDLPPQTLANPNVGVYSGTADITLTHDTKYKLTAKGGDQHCGEGEATLTVNVVDKGDCDTLCYSGILDPPNCTYSVGYMSFGPGVQIDSIKNATNFGVKVKKDSKTEFLKPYAAGTAFRGYQASGNYSLGLDASSCTVYANLPHDEQTLCVYIYLKCECP